MRYKTDLTQKDSVAYVHDSGAFESANLAAADTAKVNQILAVLGHDSEPAGTKSLAFLAEETEAGLTINGQLFESLPAKREGEWDYDCLQDEQALTAKQQRLGAFLQREFGPELGTALQTSYVYPGLLARAYALVNASFDSNFLSRPMEASAEGDRALPVDVSDNLYRKGNAIYRKMILRGRGIPTSPPGRIAVTVRVYPDPAFCSIAASNDINYWLYQCGRDITVDQQLLDFAKYQEDENFDMLQWHASEIDTNVLHVTQTLLQDKKIDSAFAAEILETAMAFYQSSTDEEAYSDYLALALYIDSSFLHQPGAKLLSHVMLKALLERLMVVSAISPALIDQIKLMLTQLDSKNVPEEVKAKALLFLLRLMKSQANDEMASKAFNEVQGLFSTPLNLTGYAAINEEQHGTFLETSLGTAFTAFRFAQAKAQLRAVIKELPENDGYKTKLNLIFDEVIRLASLPGAQLNHLTQSLLLGQAFKVERFMDSDVSYYHSLMAAYQNQPLAQYLESLFVEFKFTSEYNKVTKHSPHSPIKKAIDDALKNINEVSESVRDCVKNVLYDTLSSMGQGTEAHNATIKSIQSIASFLQKPGEQNVSAHLIRAIKAEKADFLKLRAAFLSEDNILAPSVAASLINMLSAIDQMVSYSPIPKEDISGSVNDIALAKKILIASRQLLEDPEKLRASYETFFTRLRLGETSAIAMRMQVLLASVRAELGSFTYAEGQLDAHAKHLDNEGRRFFADAVRKLLNDLKQRLKPTKALSSATKAFNAASKFLRGSIEKEAYLGEAREIASKDMILFARAKEADEALTVFRAEIEKLNDPARQEACASIAGSFDGFIAQGQAELVLILLPLIKRAKNLPTSLLDSPQYEFAQDLMQLRTLSANSVDEALRPLGTEIRHAKNDEVRKQKLTTALNEIETLRDQGNGEVALILLLLFARGKNLPSPLVGSHEYKLAEWLASLRTINSDLMEEALKATYLFLRGDITQAYYLKVGRDVTKASNSTEDGISSFVNKKLMVNVVATLDEEANKLTEGNDRKTKLQNLVQIFRESTMHGVGEHISIALPFLMKAPDSNPDLPEYQFAEAFVELSRNCEELSGPVEKISRAILAEVEHLSHQPSANLALLTKVLVETKSMNTAKNPIVAAESYQKLAKEITQHSWGRRLGQLMLVLVGVALIAASVTAIVATFGVATAPAIILAAKISAALFMNTASIFTLGTAGGAGLTAVAASVGLTSGRWDRHRSLAEQMRFFSEERAEAEPVPSTPAPSATSN